jgi:hypothetical protein
MFKILVPAAASIALVAFAARTQPVESAQPETPAMGWSLSREGAMAKLAYGVPNSDQMALMITCAPGDATAVVYGEFHPDSPRLTRASLGPAPVDPLSGGEAYETRIGLNDASLRDLAQRGALRVVSDAGRFDLPADPQERRTVAGFLSYCGTTRA